MIDAPLINNEDNNFGVSEQVSKLDLIIAQFEVGNGPQIIASTIEGLPDNFCDELFPSKWENDSYFIIKTNDLYYFCKCILAANLITSRGPLQITFALISPTLLSDDYYQPIIQ